jgi:hypothetical protein
MKNKVIPWSELSPHRLIGRDLEIKFETVVERAQIESILLGSEIMFV